jgi:hypothetical protein
VHRTIDVYVYDFPGKNPDPVSNPRRELHEMATRKMAALGIAKASSKI